MTIYCINLLCVSPASYSSCGFVYTIFVLDILIMTSKWCTECKLQSNHNVIILLNRIAQRQRQRQHKHRTPHGEREKTRQQEDGRANIIEKRDHISFSRQTNSSNHVHTIDKRWLGYRSNIGLLMKWQGEMGVREKKKLDAFLSFFQPTETLSSGKKVSKVVFERDILRLLELSWTCY